MKDPVVALPIRSFRDAYRRLAGVLDPPGRAVLARALASRTADGIRRAGQAPLIVSTAPDVRDWATANNHEMISEDPDGGLNGAARTVVRHARDRPWLILHADLPFLTPGEIGSVLEVLHSGRHVLAPSYDAGTSALGGHGAFRFSYGVASFHRHLNTGPPPAVISSLGFQLDIDSPQDLSVATHHPRGAWMARVPWPVTRDP